MLTADLLCRANSKPLKMPREQAWKYLRRMVSDGTIPDEGAKVPKKPLKSAHFAGITSCLTIEKQFEEMKTPWAKAVMRNIQNMASRSCVPLTFV